MKAKRTTPAKKKLERTNLSENNRGSMGEKKGVGEWGGRRKK